MMWAAIGSISLVASIALLSLGIVFKVRKKGNVKRYFLISAATFALFIVAVASSPTTPTDAAELSPEAGKEEAKAKAIAKMKEQQAADIKAKQNDPLEIAKKHFDSAEINLDSSNGFLEINAAGNESLTDNMTKEGMWISATQTLKALKNVPEVKDISFNITFPMVDKYGNKSEETVMKINITEGTRNKINFENFISDDLPDIADSYWEHPAFKK